MICLKYIPLLLLVSIAYIAYAEGNGFVTKTKTKTHASQNALFKNEFNQQVVSDDEEEDEGRYEELDVIDEDDMHYEEEEAIKEDDDKRELEYVPYGKKKYDEKIEIKYESKGDIKIYGENGEHNEEGENDDDEEGADDDDEEGENEDDEEGENDDDEEENEGNESENVHEGEYDINESKGKANTMLTDTVKDEFKGLGKYKVKGEGGHDSEKSGDGDSGAASSTVRKSIIKKKPYPVWKEEKSKWEKKN